MFFKFALEYAIRRVQVNQDALKLNGTHLVLVFADNVHTIRKNTETSIIAVS